MIATLVERETPTLWDALERVYSRVAPPGATSKIEEPVSFIPATLSVLRNPSDPVEKLRELFELSAFELDLLLLCAGAAIDRRFASAFAAVQPESPWLSFGLAAEMLEQPHWSALSRLRPLRFWRLIDVAPGSMLQAQLTIDERILQYLLGVPAADPGLELTIHPLFDSESSRVSGQWNADVLAVAERGAAQWRPARSRGPILLTAGGAEDRSALFRAICDEAGLQPWVMDAADLPETSADRERLARAFTREAALSAIALLVRTERVENTGLLQAWLQRVDAPIAVEVEEGTPAERLRGIRLAVPVITRAQRKALWQRQLGPLAAELETELDAMMEVFALSAGEIEETAEAIHNEALRSPLWPEASSLGQTAWAQCRKAARRSLDELATRVESNAAWTDLKLPEAQAVILHQIVAHARQAAMVHEEWGFAGRYTGGLGLSALFSGASGTGKTMAARVLARELDRDLYQIDLATVVSKYIGETEKHLRSIFQAAERSGAILLFDEADALFGKRSQVRDSLDRYANLEVSYLLQRLESYRGIAILTSNMQNALDPAFQRRLRFIVQFPFPDAASREKIWRGVFPPAAPTSTLDFERLSQLNVTGGVIRNIALLSAFLASDAGTEITMRNVLDAARTEYAKLDKPLTAAETRGWA